MTPLVFTVRPEPMNGQTMPAWLHFALVSDECVVWIECLPAAWSGWNVRTTWTQNGDKWPGMSAAAIVAFKQEDPRYPFVPATDGERAMLDRFFFQL